MKVSIKDLEAIIYRINAITGSPVTKRNAEGSTNVNHFCLYKTLSGCQLARTCNEGGGQVDISPMLTSGELKLWMEAFILGNNTSHIN